MTPEPNLRLPLLEGNLPPGEVHVWLANLYQPQPAVERMALLLNSEEQERARRFQVHPARKQFVISRGFLKTVLAKYTNRDPRAIAFRLTSHGKPELAENLDQDRGIHFNLSHTERLAAIGITRVGPIGIDVEYIHREIEVIQLADRFFSKKEAAWVRSQPEPERTAGFLACWTAKEAYVKAHGAGLSIPLDAFAVIPDRENLPLEIFGKPEESDRWSIRRLDLPQEFRGAFAVEGKIEQLRSGRFEFES